MKKKAIAFNAHELVRSAEEVRDAVSYKPGGSLLAEIKARSPKVCPIISLPYFAS